MLNYDSMCEDNIYFHFQGNMWRLLKEKEMGIRLDAIISGVTAFSQSGKKVENLYKLLARKRTFTFTSHYYLVTTTK